MNRPRPAAKTPPDGDSRLNGAFTLIELLVVIAVILILASLLLPSLAQSKLQAQGAICGNNTRQLMVGCLMYCDDNTGFFPYNMAGPAVHTNINWASDLLDWETNSDNTNIALLTATTMGGYEAQSLAAYHCPSDTVLSAIQRSAGWLNRVRTYSMNASVGDAGEITQSGVNTNNPKYVQFFKISSMPSPALIFVFMEEHPDTIYDGYFLNIAYSNEWMRLPASYHGGGANVSFADGHAELHHWQNPATKPPSQPDGASSVLFTQLPFNQRADFAWVIAHMTVRGN